MLLDQYILFNKILLLPEISLVFLPITYIDISLHSDLKLWRKGNKVTHSLPFDELCFNFLYSFQTSIDIVNVSCFFSEAWLNGKYEKVCHTLCDRLNRKRR